MSVTLLRDNELAAQPDAIGPSKDDRPMIGRRASDQAMEAAVTRLSALTSREREVLRELVTGKQSKHIARSLKISPRTVEAHRASLMDRLGASSFAEVIVLAIHAGETPDSR